MSNYPIHLKWRKARRISSLPCSFYIRKNCEQCIRYRTTHVGSSISKHGFVATWPRIEKTYNIFWMVSKPGYLSPATQFPGCSPSCALLVNQAIRNLCIVPLLSFLIFFNSVTNDQEEARTSLSVYFLKRRPLIVRYVASDAIFYGSVLICYWIVLIWTIYGIFYGG